MKSLLLLLGYLSVSFTPIFSMAVAETIPNQQLLQQKESSESSLTKEEKAIFVKAISKLLGQERYQIESEMELTGDAPGVFVKSNVQIKTTIEAPHKIISEIIFFSPNGLQGNQYKVISDGNKVWIYDLHNNVYSVSDYVEFTNSNDGFFLGMLPYFYLHIRDKVKDADLIANFLTSLSDDKLSKFLEEKANINLEEVVGKNEILEGNRYLVYEFNEPTQGFVLNTFVDPLIANIKQVHIVGNYNNIDINVKEKIINKIILPAISLNKFRFFPPENSQRVEKQISIQPF